MESGTARSRFDITVRVLGIVLLLVCIWQGQVVIDMIQDKPKGSGQTVSQGGVTTERWEGETLKEWADRHLEAVQEFEREAASD